MLHKFNDFILSWHIQFTRDFQDWELESVNGFSSCCMLICLPHPIMIRPCGCLQGKVCLMYDCFIML